MPFPLAIPVIGKIGAKIGAKFAAKSLAKKSAAKAAAALAKKASAKKGVGKLATGALIGSTISGNRAKSKGFTQGLVSTGNSIGDIIDVVTGDGRTTRREQNNRTPLFIAGALLLVILLSKN